MNALQTAVAMVFAGLLSVVIVWIVDMQAQQVFESEVTLPSYAPPFDAFHYRITLRNVDGVLYVQMDMTAYRGSASASASLSRAVYTVADLRKPEGVVKIYAQAGEGGDCIEYGWVDLTQSGCYTVWAMPSPQTIRYLRFVVTGTQ
jgi:hypothetical protein